MILENLKQIVDKNKNIESPLYLRNLLKESLQLYVLNYIYTSKYGSNFLFTGGTCLRICFDLPRLSEDLDFDLIDITQFNVYEFEKDIQDYFRKTLQYKDITTKISKGERTMFLKFPILEKLGVNNNPAETNILFLRIDITPMASTVYTKELSIKSTHDFSFLINRYSLKDLFASKIAAIIRRVFVKGKRDTPFKARDYFDLIWFMEKRIYPDYQRIGDLLKIYSKDEILQLLNNKVENINISHLKEDLSPFIKDQEFASNFAEKYKALYSTLTTTRIDYSKVDALSHTPVYLELEDLSRKYPQYEKIFSKALHEEAVPNIKVMMQILLKNAKGLGDKELLNDLQEIRM